MAPLAGFLHFVVDGLLGLLVLALIIAAIMSWLVAFDVINLRNNVVRSIYYFLERITRPVLRPVQRFVPPLGGVDLSIIIVILIIQGARIFLLPPLFAALASLG